MSPNTALLKEINLRLTSIADVLQREHDWLLPRVTQARAEFEDGIKHGYKDEMERGWDDLLIKSSQVDTHLTTIRQAAEFLVDIRDVLKAAFSPANGEAT